MRQIVLVGFIIIALLGGSCAHGQDLDTGLKSIVEPYAFSIARWELKALAQGLIRWISGRPATNDDGVSAVIEYFSATERIKSLRDEIKAVESGQPGNDLASLESEVNRLQERKAVLSEAVERTIEAQMREVLSEQGIFNPLAQLKVGFPPVNFRLEHPPNLLVISPREKIESMREILLRAGLTTGEMKDIEAKADELGVSSLVVEIGGLGATYPTFVTDDASLRFTLDTTVEEWLHQYLAFKPLGFLYLLDLTGIARNYDIATMNETLAGMVSREIGSLVYEKYYADSKGSANQGQPAGSEFDFDREMREIRRAVDDYLARGEIEPAEEFMEQKRQYLAANGYYIRKLNQAYFAFHGTYADKPASISPIGMEMSTLRAQSASLKEFLDTVARMTSRQALKASIEQ